MVITQCDNAAATPARQRIQPSLHLRPKSWPPPLPPTDSLSTCTSPSSSLYPPTYRPDHKPTLPRSSVEVECRTLIDRRLSPWFPGTRVRARSTRPPPHLMRAERGPRPTTSKHRPPGGPSLRRSTTVHSLSSAFPFGRRYANSSSVQSIPSRCRPCSISKMNTRNAYWPSKRSCTLFSSPRWVPTVAIQLGLINLRVGNFSGRRLNRQSKGFLFENALALGDAPCCTGRALLYRTRVVV